MSSLENVLDNMLYEIKNKKNTDREVLKNKYNEIFNASEKLFDKLLDPSLKSNEIEIIRVMLKTKEAKEKGLINKDEADKEIGEILCDKIVKPLLKKNNKK